MPNTLCFKVPKSSAQDDGSMQKPVHRRKSHKHNDNGQHGNHLNNNSPDSASYATPTPQPRQEFQCSFSVVNIKSDPPLLNTLAQ